MQEKRIPNPGNKSFQVIKEAVDDKLILAKLHFCKCIASELQPFLPNYQTDKPMVCFLATDLSTLLRALMRRFIKDDLLSEATTVEKVMVVDIEEKSNHKSYKKIEHSKWFEPRSISSSYCVIVWVRVVLKRTVVGD